MFIPPQAKIRKAYYCLSGPSLPGETADRKKRITLADAAWRPVNITRRQVGRHYPESRKDLGLMRYRLFCFVMAALIAVGIGACGGEGKSSDPLGTDSLTFGDSSGSAVLQLDPNGAVQLTAKVTDAAGKPVADRDVTFELVSNTSGASINFSRVGTNTAGEATISYRAGASPGRDVVRASISDSSRIDVSIIVGGGIAGTQVSLAASPTSLEAGQTSIITATVTDGSGAPILGRAVTFAFSANNSGAALATLNGTTDVSGRAIAVYTAGTANPTANVWDTVQASVTGSVDAIPINRTATGGGVQISLAGAPTSLSAGQNSIITATVTDSAGSPMQGQPVTFAFSANNSGATLVTLGGTTDVSGRAVAVYTAGSITPAAEVQDTVRASVTGSVGVVVITRTATTGGGLNLSLASSVTSLAAGQSAVITATVTDGASVPVSGQTVTFAFSPNGNNSGATLVTLSGTTDASGRAVAQYTAGANSPTTSVNDTVLASVTGSAAAVVITRTVGAAAGFQIAVTATPASLVAGSTSIIAATVSNADGTAAAGQTVTLAISTNNSGAALTLLNGGRTDAGGKALALYTAGALLPGQSVQDIVTAALTGAVAAAVITRQATVVAGNRISALTAIPSTLSVVTGGTSTITVTVTGSDNVTPIPNVAVTFSIIQGRGSEAVTPTDPAGMTGNNGRATAIFTGPAGAIAGTQSVVRATITGSDAVVIINWQ